MMEGENQWTKSTRKQIARLTSLTEKLVFLSRMDEETTTLDMQIFAISDAVIDTAEPFIGLAASRGKTLTCDIAPDLTYYGNEGSIRQLISLLLDNAVKYSTDDGQIRLSFHNAGRNLILQVWNMMEILFFLQLHFPHKNSFLLKKRQRLFYSLCRFYFCNIQLFQESKRAYDWCFLCFSETYLEEADNLYNEKNYRTNSTCDWNNHGKEKNHCNNSN